MLAQVAQSAKRLQARVEADKCAGSIVGMAITAGFIGGHGGQIKASCYTCARKVAVPTNLVAGAE